MQLVTTSKGLELREVFYEKIGLQLITKAILNSILLALIPFGAFVMLATAIHHFNRLYVPCFYNNGLQDIQCLKHLNEDELKGEKIIALIYIGGIFLFRAVPIICYLLSSQPS